MANVGWVSLQRCCELTQDQAFAERSHGSACRIKYYPSSEMKKGELSWHVAEKSLIETWAKYGGRQTSSPMETIESTESISMQLYGGVRTEKVDLSLRLLNHGADPNFQFKQRSNNTPLHIAALSGQGLQVELLFANGADPWICNDDGQTAADLARQGGHEELASRLIAMQYTLSDSIMRFACPESFRMVDHECATHFVLPGDYGTASFSERFSKLADDKFAHLCEDLYDEIERRTLNEYCPKTHKLPFLPVLTKYSKTRNQTRQQLAKFPEDIFNEFCLDILYELACRMNENVHCVTTQPEEDESVNYSTLLNQKRRPGSNEMELISPDDIDAADVQQELESLRADLERQSELLAERTAQLGKSEAARHILEENLTKLASDRGILSKSSPSSPTLEVRAEKRKSTDRTRSKSSDRSTPAKEGRDRSRQQIKSTASAAESLSSSEIALQLSALPEKRVVAVKSKQVSHEILNLMKAYKAGEAEKSKEYLKRSNIEIKEFLTYFPRITITEPLITSLENQLEKLIDDMNGGTEKFTNVLRCLHEMAMLIKRLVQICSSGPSVPSSQNSSFSHTSTAESSSTAACSSDSDPSTVQQNTTL